MLTYRMHVSCPLGCCNVRADACRHLCFSSLYFCIIISLFGPCRHLIWEQGFATQFLVVASLITAGYFALRNNHHVIIFAQEYYGALLY